MPLRPWICSLQPRNTQMEWFYHRAKAYLAAGEHAKAAADFEKIIGHRGWPEWELFAPLAQLGLARAYAMQGTVGTAAKPTMISSPLGKTRTRISRCSVKPKPNIRNSPQPHLPSLQHLGSNRAGGPAFPAVSACANNPGGPRSFPGFGKGGRGDGWHQVFPE